MSENQELIQTLPLLPLKKKLLPLKLPKLKAKLKMILKMMLKVNQKVKATNNTA